MADVIRKRVTLHPLKKNGQMDLNVNLYPKCRVDGVVDKDGNPVNVVVSNEPGVSIEQVVTQLEAEIAEHGGVTPEDLEEVLQGYATVEVVDPLVEDIDDLTTHVGQIDIQLNNKQDFPPIGEGEELYFRIPIPITSEEILRSTLEDLDVEFIKRLIDDGYHQSFDNFGEVWAFEATSENSADIVIIVGDIKYLTSIAIETDAETGDQRIVVGEAFVSTVVDTDLLNDSIEVTNQYAEEISNQIGHNIFPIYTIFTGKDIYTAEELHENVTESSLYISERGQYIYIPINNPANDYSITVYKHDTDDEMMFYCVPVGYYLGELNHRYIKCFLQYVPDDQYYDPCLIDIDVVELVFNSEDY